MTRNSLLLLFILFFSCSSRNSQNEPLKLRLIDAEVDFISFYSLNVGPAAFHDTITDFRNAGYKHRVFVSVYEIFCVVFIDKISLDTEGGISELLWFRRLDLGAFYTHYSFNEETACFTFIEWTDNDKFLFGIRDRRFMGKIVGNGEWVEVKSM